MIGAVKGSRKKKQKVEERKRGKVQEKMVQILPKTSPTISSRDSSFFTIIAIEEGRGG